MHALLIPVVSAIIASFDPAIISKFARSAPPLTFNAIRALIATLLLGLFIVISGNGIFFTAFWALLLIIASGMLGPGIGGSAYIKAIQIMGGSLPVVITHTYIFVAQFLSALLVGESLTLSGIIGGALAFTGILVALLKNGAKFNSKGVALASVAAFSWGTATVIIKLVDMYTDIYTLALFRLFGVFLFTMPLGLLRGEKVVVNHDFIIASAYGGILSWGIGMFLYVYAVHTLGVSATVIITAITPILSQAANRFIAREKLSGRVLIGASLVALAIAIQVVH
ncbi:MAG: DMT family transporter [Desulfurococcaceae archaeon]